MFRFPDRPHARRTIDFDAMRDTLLYLESDLTALPQHARLLEAIREALSEIDRLQLSEPERAARFEPTGATFLPVRP